MRVSNRITPPCDLHGEHAAVADVAIEEPDVLRGGGPVFVHQPRKIGRKVKSLNMFSKAAAM